MLLTFINNLNKTVDRLVYLEGNHELHSENHLQLMEDIQLNISMYHKIDDIVITHGHTDVDVEANDYIIGHIHPKKQGKDVYHYKSREYKNGNLTIMPAFADQVNGVDINNYNGICPFLGSDTKEYKHLIPKNI
jgi:metallophosphoesterase superfamily enzyme